MPVKGLETRRHCFASIRHDQHRSRFDDRIALLLVGVHDGVTAIAGNDPVSGLAHGHDAVGDVVLLGEGVEVVHPLRADFDALPHMGAESRR